MTWLQINNLLYQSVIINYDILLSISDEFIPKSILSRVVIMENNNFKYKGYEVNLAENNKKNNSHHVIGSVGINQVRVLNGYIYTDINESKQNVYLQLIFTITIFLIIIP